MEILATDKQYYKPDILFYTKYLKGNKKMCLICQIPDETNNIYDKYKLTCNHIYHSRCYKKYCYYIDNIKCPLCGEIKPLKEFKKYLK